MLLTRSRSGFVLADLSFFPFVEPVIRIEDFRKDNRYIVRAEIPGVDVAKDVDITCKDGYLHLVVARSEETKDRGRSEFRYGTFHRTVALPPDTKEETITANYSDGILEITMTVGEPIESGKHIAIEIGNGHAKAHEKA